MKKDNNLALRINSEIKEALARHKISPQRLFDEAVLNELRKHKLSNREQGIVLDEAMRLYKAKK